MVEVAYIQTYREEKEYEKQYKQYFLENCKMQLNYIYNNHFTPRQEYEALIEKEMQLSYMKLMTEYIN